MSEFTKALVMLDFRETIVCTDGILKADVSKRARAVSALISVLRYVLGYCCCEGLVGGAARRARLGQLESDWQFPVDPSRMLCRTKQIQSDQVVARRTPPLPPSYVLREEMPPIVSG